MKRNPSDPLYRHYYVDHPSSPTHRDPYLLPLENQYSILSRARNPYEVLDHLNFEVNQKYTKNAIATHQQESLTNQMKQWDRKQHQKENTYKNLKTELKGLSKLVKLQEQNLQKSRQDRHMMQSNIIPMPIFMPMGGMGGCQSMNNHCCRCQCSCSCQRQHMMPRPMSKIKKYKPIATQSTVEPLPPISMNSISSMPSSLTTRPKIEPKEIVKLQKKKKGNLLRRFRICAYAVYFCIYFKWFSFQFSLNRYTRFKGKYLIDSGKEITNAYRQVYYKLLGVQIPDLIRTAVENVPDQKKGNKANIESLIKLEAVQKLNKIGDYRILSSNQQILFLRCAQFISLLFQRLQELFGAWQWGEYGNALGVGTLDLSYMIDNLFLPHQLFTMVFHDGKGYAQISPQHQRIQVMIKFIVKMLLFNVCFQLDNNKEWLEEHEEILKEKGDEQEIFIFLEISSKIMFVICQYLYEQELGGHQTNYDEVNDKFKVQPCNPLVYSHSIRKRRQLFKQKQVKQSNLLIYGIDKLDQINNIINSPFFVSAKKRITNSINSLIDQILGKLQENKRQLWADIWQETVGSEYIVLRGMKKVMKAAKHYAFVSSSVVPSQMSLPSAQSIVDNMIKTGMTKRSKNNKKPRYQVTQNDSIKESQSTIYQRPGQSKTSLAYRLPKR